MKKCQLILCVLCLACSGLLLLAGCSPKSDGDSFPPVGSEPTVKEPPKIIKWPLTGLDAPNEEAIKLRPISVKIENSKLARPQLGIIDADIVYETEVEGAMTRFNCIYQSNLPRQVGPVRSARLSDAWIVPQWGTYLFFSGSNAEVRAKLKRLRVDKLADGQGEGLWERVTYRTTPHNLYLSVKNIPKAAKKKGISQKWDARQPAFGSPSLQTTPTAIAIKIVFGPFQTTNWKWSADKARYLRSQDGAKHVDYKSDKQIGAENIIVLWADYPAAGKKDPAGNYTYDTILGGSGKAAIFKDGSRHNGTWKADKNSIPVVTDKDGKVITINAGQTWYEVVRTGKKISVSKKK